LGCELADILLGIATDVGPIATNMAAGCRPAKPISVLGIQGTSDTRIPIGGGPVDSPTSGTVLSAAATMAFWARVNGCPSAPEVVDLRSRVNDGTQVIENVYMPCSSGVRVNYYVVQGMGHSWPPQTGFGGDPTSQNVNATDVIWDFFAGL
jgi:polyhydroxybutyrate depolymerase